MNVAESEIGPERVEEGLPWLCQSNFLLTESDNVAVARAMMSCTLVLAGEPSAVGRVLQPRVVVLRTERKSEVCERYVNQLLVRGEHVALISVLEP
jgi:hypothetical protein